MLIDTHFTMEINKIFFCNNDAPYSYTPQAIRLLGALLSTISIIYRPPHPPSSSPSRDRIALSLSSGAPIKVAIFIFAPTIRASLPRFSPHNHSDSMQGKERQQKKRIWNLYSRHWQPVKDTHRAPRCVIHHVFCHDSCCWWWCPASQLQDIDANKYRLG